jgi:hypothetical protein
MSNDMQVKTAAQEVAGGAKGAGWRSGSADEQYRKVRRYPGARQRLLELTALNHRREGLPVGFKLGDVALAPWSPPIGAAQQQALAEAGFTLWRLSSLQHHHRSADLVIEAELLAKGIRDPIDVQLLVGGHRVRTEVGYETRYVPMPDREGEKRLAEDIDDVIRGLPKYRGRADVGPSGRFRESREQATATLEK